ncbi:MAG: hypothetical protein IJ329_04670 [Clostridia bacterium]|nr:hypothetical protein [Clostridia bacterium]
MKRQEQLQTKYFKIKFSKLIYVLIVGILLLSFASIGVSVWQMVRFGLHGFSDYLKYPLLLLISVFCIAVVVAMLVKSQYAVNKQYLITSYGFIKSKFPVQNITSVLQDTDTKKLTVYFGEQFIVLNLAYEWNEQFVRAILDVNPNVDYSFTMAENKPQDDNK